MGTPGPKASRKCPDNSSSGSCSSETPRNSLCRSGERSKHTPRITSAPPCTPRVGLSSCSIEPPRTPSTDPLELGHLTSTSLDTPHFGPGRARRSGYRDEQGRLLNSPSHSNPNSRRNPPSNTSSNVSEGNRSMHSNNDILRHPARRDDRRGNDGNVTDDLRPNGSTYGSRNARPNRNTSGRNAHNLSRNSARGSKQSRIKRFCSCCFVRTKANGNQTSNDGVERRRRSEIDIMFLEDFTGSSTSAGCSSIGGFSRQTSPPSQASGMSRRRGGEKSKRKSRRRSSSPAPPDFVPFTRLVEDKFLQ